MSKSYKKTAVFKDRNPWAKKLANKKVRKTNIENYKGFALLKKIFNSWNICDWKFYPTDKDSITKSLRK